MYQEPTVFPDLTVAENVFAGRHHEAARHRRLARDALRDGAQLLEELGVDFGPDTPVRGLGVADRQLLEIAKALSSSARAADHGRADRGALAARGRQPVRDRPPAARARRRDRLHQPPARGGRGDRRHRHRPPRRPPRRDAAGRRAPAGGDRPADGRALARRALPEGGGRDRRRRASRRGAHDAAASSRTSRSSCGAARSSASRASSAPAGPRSRARIFGIDRLDAGELWIDGRRFRAALAARGAAPGPRVPPGGPAPPGARPADVDRGEHVDGGAARS